MCWQTIRRLRDERSHTARSIKQQNGVPLSYEDVLGRWREYFKVLSNPVAVKPSDTQEVRFGRKVSSLQQKSSLLSKYRKLQNAMKCNLKCLKALNKCVLGLLVCSMWPGILGGGTPKDWQPGVITLYTKRETGVNAPTTEAPLSSASQLVDEQRLSYWVTVNRFQTIFENCSFSSFPGFARSINSRSLEIEPTDR